MPEAQIIRHAVTIIITTEGAENGHRDPQTAAKIVVTLSPHARRDFTHMCTGNETEKKAEGASIKYVRIRHGKADKVREFA